MVDDNNKVCLHCGAKDFVEYKQGPDAALYPIKSFFGKRKILHYNICVECGTVKRIYVPK